MLLYLSQHYIEIIGTLLSLVYLYLSIKQNVNLWIFGFLGSALYVVVFFQAKFYADMSLQFYYIGVSVYGWFSWRKGKLETGEELPVTRIGWHQAIMLTVLTVVVFFVYYYILVNYTDSPVPFGDSLTTALSITATLMLAKKMLEHWLLWIVADAVSVGLYIYRGLYPTTALFVVYTIMAVVGWISWRKSLQKSNS
jgi:nicotinamide mononucleotide transporter